MRRNKIFIIVLASCIIAQSWFAFIALKSPYLGIAVEQNKAHEWVVRSFDKASEAQKLNIRVGDVVRAIDGKDPNEHTSVMKWRYIEQADTVLFERHGERISVNMKDVPRNALFNLVPIVAEIVCFFLALLLYMKAGHSVSAKYLSLVFLNGAVAFMSNGASIRGDALGKLCIATAVTLVPTLFLHFLIVFFRDRGSIKLNARFLKYLYAVPAAYALIKSFFFLDGAYAYSAYRIASKTDTAFFIAGILIIFFLLSHLLIKYRKEQSYASKLVRIVWISLFISFSPMILFSFLPLLLTGKLIISSAYTSWFILFFPVSFAYLMMTKQLYDIDIVMRRIMLTTLVSVVPSAMIIGLIALSFPGEASAERLLLLYIFIVSITSFVLYSLEYFTTKLEPVIFPRKHHLNQALKKISKTLGSISSFRDLKDIVLVDLVGILQVYGGVIAFKYKENIELINAGEIDLEEVEKLVAEGRLDHPSFTCFEINRHEEYTSFLIMTKKKTSTMLGMEEIQWLNLIISYLAVSLENLYLIRKLTVRMQELAANMPSDEKAANEFVWFRKMMFELQEKERIRIANDLHDTTMQDLFFLKRRISTVMKRYAMTKEDTEQMDGMIEYVEIINTNLRQSCFELHPHLLQEVGLIRTVRKVVDQEALLCPFELEFRAEGADGIELRDMETKRHVFRMIQELINNAKKHSQATKVSIKLSSMKGGFRLMYEDDGVGFDTDRVVVRDIGASGIGMEQLKSRVLYLNGELELDTGVGRGVRYTITLPMNGMDGGLTA
ncbi:ATP-binding protein [Paenibacillus sp. MBLB4367]|uniref:ATP-binding protein n=1 Tax=Paenibacillus sp. MBLB4367 TaxID=3384767 RepID=UPI003907E82F